MMAHTPFAYLVHHYSWREALLIDGGMGILIFLWILLIVRDEPYSAQRTPPSISMSYFLKVLGEKQNWLAGFYTSCLNLPIMVICALWGASYVQVVHHLSHVAASNVVSQIFIGSIIGCPLVGWLSDKMSARKPLMLFGAIATLLLTLPFLFGSVFSETLLGCIFFALGFVTSTQVITYPLIAESNAKEYTGAATGIASVIIMGAQVWRNFFLVG